MKDIFQILQDLNIDYHKEEHPPVFTVEESLQHVPAMDGIGVKNLFLRNKKKSAFALLVVPDEKKVDLKAFGKLEGFQNPSFADSEQLKEMLGVEPGSATILGIIHDTENRVQVYIDQAVAQSEALQCHPLINTATLSIKLKDIMHFLEHFAHHPKTIDIPERD